MAKIRFNLLLFMITRLPSPRRGLCGLVASCVLLGTAFTRADSLVLTNGDHVSGAVVGMDQDSIQFKSDLLGVVKIPRDKVAGISLRDAAPKSLAGLAGTNGVRPAATPATRSLVTARTNGVHAAVQQLRQQGVDPKLVNQIQQQVLGDSSPEASRLFNEMVGGLTSGSLSVEDIRGQARKAVKDIQAAKTDLGADDAIGELLNGYLGVLQSFLQDSEETPPVTIKAAPTAAKIMPGPPKAAVRPPVTGNLSVTE